MLEWIVLQYPNHIITVLVEYRELCYVKKVGLIIDIQDLFSLVYFLSSLSFNDFSTSYQSIEKNSNLFEKTKLILDTASPPTSSLIVFNQ